MPNCQIIDPLVTPYVDGQLAEADRQAVDQHLRVCPPCRSRVTAERAVHTLIAERRDALSAPCASQALRAKCREHARAESAVAASRLRRDALGGAFSAAAWRARMAPLAAAASLVLIVGAAFLYQLTVASNRVMAAELAADHLKCFAVNGVLRTHQDAPAVESAMLSSFGWQMRVPPRAREAGLELVGARPCLYGEGKVAHIMYRHGEEPVSLFMLPRATRTPEVLQVLGHKAAIWCEGDRTFVLVAREPKEDVERMAALVRASLK
jgi:anti-sigma factor RsiW